MCALPMRARGLTGDLLIVSVADVLRRVVLSVLRVGRNHEGA